VNGRKSGEHGPVLGSEVFSDRSKVLLAFDDAVLVGLHPCSVTKPTCPRGVSAEVADVRGAHWPEDRGGVTGTCGRRRPYTTGAEDQLAALRQAVQGLGPGASLANKVADAQSQLAAGDTQGPAARWPASSTLCAPRPAKRSRRAPRHSW
jgi:hypothetical protein